MTEPQRGLERLSPLAQSIDQTADLGLCHCEQCLSLPEFLVLRFSQGLQALCDH